MVLKKLLYSVVGCMLFTSCYDEDALTPGDRVLESRFEFPQGSKVGMKRLRIYWMNLESI